METAPPPPQANGAPSAPPGAKKPEDLERGVVVYTPPGMREPIRLNVAIVRKFFCRDADEMSAYSFMGFCKANGLDPFKHEAYLMIMEEDGRPKPQIVVAYTVFMKRAERHPQHDGFDAGLVVIETPRAEGVPAPPPLRNRLPEDLDPPLVAIRGTICPPGYQVVGGWCHARRKDQKTTPAIVPLNEYLRRKRDGGVMKNWKTGDDGGKQNTMIRKTAIAHGHRESFTDELAGWYLHEELGGQTPPPSEPIAPPAVDEPEVVFPEELLPLFEALEMTQGAREMFMGEMAALQKTTPEMVEVLKGRIAERAAAVVGALAEGRPLERIEIAPGQREPVAVATTDGQMKLA